MRAGPVTAIVNTLYEFAFRNLCQVARGIVQLESVGDRIEGRGIDLAFETIERTGILGGLSAGLPFAEERRTAGGDPGQFTSSHLPIIPRRGSLEMLAPRQATSPILSGY